MFLSTSRQPRVYVCESVESGGMLTPKLQLGLQGLGVSPCDVNFVGPLTEEQQATCLAQIIPDIAVDPATAALTKTIGQSVCPSVKQMQGIVDPNDPCQASTAQTSPAILLAKLKLAQQLGDNQSPSTTQDNTATYIVIGGAVLFVVLMALVKK